jgi:hypothetical protein
VRQSRVRILAGVRQCLVSLIVVHLAAAVVGDGAAHERYGAGVVVDDFQVQ